MPRRQSLLYPAIFLCLSGSLFAQPWSGILSPSRAVDWSAAGVPGGIPSGSWPQCGATIAAGASASTINAAIAACGTNQYVQLAAGTFNISGGIIWNHKSNVALRGMGANQTFLVFSSNNVCQGFGADVCFQSSDVNYSGGPSNTATWTAGYAPGATSITLSSKTNLAVGSPIVLDQLDDYSQLFTSGWTANTGNIWQVSDSTQPMQVYFNSTTGTQVGSVAAITAPNQWFWASNVLYVYSTSNPATAFTALGVSATGDTGDLFICYTPQFVCGTNGDSGGAPRAGRSQQQIVTVTSISGTGPYTVGITPAIRMPNWSSAKAPGAWWATSPIFSSGIENMSLDHTASEPAQGTGVGIEMFNCDGCWVSGVRSISPGRSHVQMVQGSRITIQNNYFYKTAGTTSTSYGVESFPASDVLVQNNIFQDISEPESINGTCSGCVLAYNFDISNTYGSPGSYNWLMHSVLIHAVGADNMLLEGNQGAGLQADIIHGSHNFITFFRNASNGYQSDNGTNPTGNLGALIVNSFSRFFNIVGNVLGTTAFSFTHYQQTPTNAVPNSTAVMDIGFGDETPNDTNVARTVMLWGNYDTVSAAVRWCGNSTDPGWSTTCASTSEVPSGIANYANPVPSSTTLPASFYLSSQPSWWPSAKPWPPVGPDVTGGNMSGLGGHAYTIPAADCYSNVMGGPANGTGAVLSFNAATCYGQQTGSSPAPPTGLSASAISSSSINLSWTASTGATGYAIYRGGVQVGTSATNSYSDTGLAASTQYTYTVTAFNGTGTSAQSTSASATTAAQTTDTQAPTTPQSLTASAVSSSAISLSWAASTDNVGVTGYTIYRGGVQVGTSATNGYTDTGLAASTQYTYAVSAFDAAGNQSTQSTTASATTSAQTSAGTPTLVQHVATGMDRYPVTNLKIPLPNPAGAGNALILGIQFHSSGSISSVADNEGNTWVAGPTATNSAAAQGMSLYYALNVTGGTQYITVTFSGLGSTNSFPQAVLSEFYNVAQVSAADGSVGSATSRTAGAITTTTAGDLVYHWGVDFSDTNVNGGAYNGSNIAAGAGFTLLSADLQVGSADQYQVQSSAGSINPTFTASGAATWGSLALALKPASAGTPPPPGIRIVHIQHTLLNSVRAQSRPNPIVMQFPSSGNLLVGLYNSAGQLISGVSDGVNNTWVSAASTPGEFGGVGAQIMYAGNASTGPNLAGITVALNGSTTGDDMFDLYDITGAATSPFDTATTALGNQTSAGNLTTTTLTPATANGLVLNVVSIDFHTVNGIVGANFVLDSDVNSLDNDDPDNGGTEVSTLDMDNGYAHIYNATTGPVTFVYTYNQTTPGGVQLWGSAAAAFKAASGGGAPASPTGLTATVQ